MISVLKSSKFVGLIAAVSAGAALIAAGPEHAEHKDKAEINKAAPDFTLTDVSGAEHTLSAYTEAGKVVVVEWFNPDCPIVKNRYAGETKPTIEMEERFGEDVVWLRVNSGAEGKQGAGVERNKKAMEDYEIDTAILLDMSGEVGKAYGAKVTPEIFIVDAEGVLRYHGAIDSKPGSRDIGEDLYLEAALKAVLAGETVATQETKATGCGVKYGS